MEKKSVRVCSTPFPVRLVPASLHAVLVSLAWQAGKLVWVKAALAEWSEEEQSLIPYSSPFLDSGGFDESREIFAGGTLCGYETTVLASRPIQGRLFGGTHSNTQQPD